MQPIDRHENIYTISQLNKEAKLLLEGMFPAIWVEGEISNFSTPHSGHWYFSLKDANAQVRAALFKGSQRKINFTPKDGMHVLVRARVSLYENRGDYQLIAEFMEERGEGKLQRAFLALQKKLAALGLFEQTHKKRLPPYPATIGIITSPTGAAIRDILHVLKRRYPCAQVIIYPTLVQGEQAATNIVAAIKTAEARQECDVLILARGGGSLEDLWPFNEEIVAHAVYACKIPTISGVGHEVDFTICDFVADVRAPTPSAAAELATPDREELLQAVKQLQSQTLRLWRMKFSMHQQQLLSMEKHLALVHPKRRLLEKMQRLDQAEAALTQLQIRHIENAKRRLLIAENRLSQLTPAHTIRQLQNRLHLYLQQLNNQNVQRLQKHQSTLSAFAAALDALSPLATLKRGYAVPLDEKNHLVRSIKQVQVNSLLTIRLTDGLLTCLVQAIDKQ